MSVAGLGGPSGGRCFSAKPALFPFLVPKFSIQQRVVDNIGRRDRETAGVTVVAPFSAHGARYAAPAANAFLIVTRADCINANDYHILRRAGGNQCHLCEKPAARVSVTGWPIGSQPRRGGPVTRIFRQPAKPPQAKPASPQRLNLAGDFMPSDSLAAHRAPRVTAPACPLHAFRPAGLPRYVLIAASMAGRDAR